MGPVGVVDNGPVVVDTGPVVADMRRKVLASGSEVAYIGPEVVVAGSEAANMGAQGHDIHHSSPKMPCYLIREDRLLPCRPRSFPAPRALALLGWQPIVLSLCDAGHTSSRPR